MVRSVVDRDRPQVVVVVRLDDRDTRRVVRSSAREANGPIGADQAYPSRLQERREASNLVGELGVLRSNQVASGRGASITRGDLLVHVVRVAGADPVEANVESHDVLPSRPIIPV